MKRVRVRIRIGHFLVGWGYSIVDAGLALQGRRRRPAVSGTAQTFRPR